VAAGIAAARYPGGTGPRVLVAGASGYIGRVVVRELLDRGYRVSCILRRPPSPDDAAFAGARLLLADLTRPESLSAAMLGEEVPEMVVSCLATRTGGIADAWAVEYQANLNLLRVAETAGSRQFLLLSAICVQKPLLAFQKAKLAFEQALMDSQLTWSIVRPTAFFKSLAGQVARVQAGKPFMVFGNGELTACKPISEADLADFMLACLESTEYHNRILPIGGPGPAITPRQQGELLFRLCGQPAKFRQLPLGLFDAAIAVLGGLSRLVPALADKAEFARIGRYYGSESMLLLNPASGRFDADATPSWGNDTLEAFYRRVLAQGLAGQELGEHKLF
jgi:divinyl chlorophyllide a 8-vinyl-reductase